MFKLNAAEEQNRTGVLQSYSPVDGTLVGAVKLTSPEEVPDIVSAAWEGFAGWARYSLAGRARILRRFGDLLLQRSEEVARLITLEMGKPLVESFAAEIEACLDLIHYYTKYGRRFLEPKPVRLHNPFFWRRKNTDRIEPLGVLGIITPWNWPLLIPLGQIIPALLAGNAVVFKPSEHTPLSGKMIAELLYEAGIPPSVFQVVYGFAGVGQALIGARISKIFFTGSTAVGWKVMQQAAESFKRAVLELGGNDPAIVCADADLEYTTSGLLWGGFNNCGQNCNGVERIYVHRSVEQKFVKLLADKLAKLRLGNSLREDVELGPLANEAQLQKTARIVQEAQEQGAELICGGKRSPALGGLYFEPTILRWPSVDREPEGEEVFGPVVFVTPFDTREEALRAANRSQYGLTASVWSRNREEAETLVNGLQAGNVLVNDCVVSFGFPEASWTGWKKSGFGWVHGEKGIDEMVRIKFVTIEPQNRSQKLWWFPYTPSVMTAMRSGVQFLFARNPLQKIKALPGVVRHMTGYLFLNRRRKDKL